MAILPTFIERLERRTGRALALVALFTLAAAYVASHLSIDADLKRLLPDGAPSVVGLNLLERSYGGQIGRLTVVLERRAPLESTHSEAGTLADGLAPLLAVLEDVDRVEARKPVDFFMDRRLLYADVDDLEEASRRIKRRIRWEKQQKNPLFASLGDRPPPEIDLSDLVDRYASDDRRAETAYYLSEDASALAIFVYPAFPASDLNRSRALVDRVEAAVGAYLDEAGPGWSFALTGRYKKRVDLQQTLQDDLAAATGLALILLFAFLLAYLRSLFGAVAVLVPIAVATVWTFAWAELVFGSLNILTGFLGAILMGLGVDYGIHLYTRFHDQLRRQGLRDALVETLATSGRVNLLAGLSTAVAFASLTLSEFRAFFEFGVIAAGGLLLVLAAYVVLFPALLLVGARFGHRPRAPLSEVLSAARAGRSGQPGPARRWSRAGISAVLGATIALTLGLGALGLSQVRFERSFKVLETASAPAWALDETVNRIIGHSQTPSVVLTDTPEITRAVVAELERRRETSPLGYTIDKILYLEALVPDDQPDKLELLADLHDQLDGLPDTVTTEALREHQAEIARVLALGPVTTDGLPVEVVAPFRRTDGPERSVVLVLPAIDLADNDRVRDYVDALRELPGVDHDGYDAISDAALLVDIVRYVERDAIWMLSATLVGLLVLSILFFRRRRDVLRQFVMLAGAIWAAVGVIGLVGVPFNFLNIIVLPIWLGLGIDASFHVLFLLREPDAGPHTHLATAAAIAAAFLTSTLGFGAMLVAHHDGLASLGTVAVLGLLTMLLIQLGFHGYLYSRR